MGTSWIRRHVLFGTNAESGASSPPEDELYDAAVVDGCSVAHDNEVAEFLTDHVSPATVAKRIRRDDCTCYLARERSTATPVGLCWAVVPTDDRVWYDGVPVDPGDGLVFDCVVCDGHDEDRVLDLLRSTAREHLAETRGCTSVSFLLDARDAAAVLAADDRELEPSLRTYTFEPFGIDILSVLRRGSVTETHLLVSKPSL